MSFFGNYRICCKGGETTMQNPEQGVVFGEWGGSETATLKYNAVYNIAVSAELTINEVGYRNFYVDFYV
jgi:hypothetical protein